MGDSTIADMLFEAVYPVAEFDNTLVIDVTTANEVRHTEI